MISILFISGILFISNKYNIHDSPVLENGFNILYDWVHVFSYLFVIPTVLLTAYTLLKMIPKLSARMWIRVTMYIFWIALLAGSAYISLWVCTLIKLAAQKKTLPAGSVFVLS
ncbi:hypothetical protein CHH53_11765 [Terribacillus sp. 7520-G]|nr:hypothetical protein CHH53_11765 [Terribacillus sp. 7520-G]